ncbi:hypothetical protein DMB44_03640 [Thermoplasma sp. Kam2015]|uniref:glycosyltransferase n=1 Tax=Thermoplasma sp. Kam2015 TaxID=2094122 RepID=UPI000D954EEF|nr:glycosyltransferase [Thermoplasma sp. Kam2015]PYB68445.1 hypothetical protein DMB44_03640 [Thermoplasma sp. Kam2015]
MPKYPICINTSNTYTGIGTYASIITEIVGEDHVISLVLDKNQKDRSFPGTKMTPKKWMVGNGYVINSLFPSYLFDLNRSFYHYLDTSIVPVSTDGIVTIHDLYHPKNEPIYMRKIRKFKINKYKKFKNIIAISKTTMKSMIEAGFDEKNIQVIHHGNSKNWKKYDDIENIKRQYGLPRDRKIALTVGDGIFKNNHLVTEALKNSEFIHVHIGNDAGDINFVRLSEEDLNKIMCASDVLIRVSSNEGFGIPPMQATALGVPIVLSKLPVFKELFGKYAFFTEIDKASILESVRHAVKYRDDYLQKSRPYVDYFSFSSFKARMDSYYSKIKN